MALSQLNALKNLYANKNDIGNEGAKFLAKALQLENLGLSHNVIGDDGAFALADTTHLYTLDVGFNQINTDGIQALKNNEIFTFLNTQGNPGDGKNRLNNGVIVP